MSQCAPSKPKFTPSPWVAERRGLNFIVVFAGDEAGSRLSPCFIADGQIVEQQANAHLIAAAPKMYHRLVQLADDLEIMLPEAVVMIEALLAEARGESL